MSIDEISTLALLMALVSIAALVLVGRRKPARATRRLPRDARSAVMLTEAPTVIERRPHALRRLAASIGLGATSLVVGALIALLVAVSIAVAVVTLSGLLE